MGKDLLRKNYNLDVVVTTPSVVKDARVGAEVVLTRPAVAHRGFLSKTGEKVEEVDFTQTVTVPFARIVRIQSQYPEKAIWKDSDGKNVVGLRPRVDSVKVSGVKSIRCYVYLGEDD